MIEIINNPFFEFAAILFIAAVIGLIGNFMKQPLIVSFIGVGIMVGPYGLNLIQSIDQIHLMAELGIAILLFAVGLKLDLKLIRSTGKVALFTGLGQVLFTSVVGYFIATGLGFPVIPALYIAVALTFSSTIIIVKLLSDKKEIDSLHGQISIGFLIVQDIVVILVMIFLSALDTKAQQNSVLGEVILVVIKGLGFLGIIGLSIRYFIPYIIKLLGKSQELLLLFSISWALLLASAGDFLGFSKEVGAFLAGVSLASTDYRELISTKLITLRDFLLLFFFINLGSHLDMGIVSGQIRSSLVFSLFVLLGNPIIVLIIMGLMGYRKRTSFLAGLNVAQISEFSLILASLGLALGHINQEVVGLITLVGLITIGLSTYMILYSHQIFEKLSFLLHVFERKNPYREARLRQIENISVDAIIFGLGRYGNNIAKSLERIGKVVMGVDFDPQAVLRWKQQGRFAQQGDADDPDLHELLPLQNTKVIISTVPDFEINLYLVKLLRLRGYKGRIALTQHQSENSQKLLDSGADLILYPYEDAAEDISHKLNCF
jgi:Kef-type K+ transport system membrane component KefB